MGLWSYDPEHYNGDPVNIKFPGEVRESGGPPLLGEYVGSSQPIIPTATAAAINAWEAGGKVPFVTSYQAVINSASQIIPPTTTSRHARGVYVGAELPGAYNAHLAANFIIYRAGTMLKQVTATKTAAYWQTQHANVPWQLGDFPLGNPIGAIASVAPRPVAYAPPRIDPWSPEMPDVGPRPAPRPNPNPWPEPYPAPYPNPNPSPNPNPNPNPVPGIVSPPKPNGSSAVVQAPNGRPRPGSVSGPRPPGRGTKERKAGLPPWAAFAWRAAGPITEGVDLIDAVYEALPKSLKQAYYRKYKRQPNPLERLRIIYLHINKLNMGDVVKNIVEMQIEDFISGKAGQALTSAGKNMYPDRPIQLGAGPAL